jgi:predicted alpha/beta-fold hydrolase
VLTEEEADKPEGRPILVVLSGLTASKVEFYIVEFFGEAVLNKRWRTVLYNDRLYNNRFFKDPERASLPR